MLNDRGVVVLGLLTRVEIGHIRMGSARNGRIKSRGHQGGPIVGTGLQGESTTPSDGKTLVWRYRFLLLSEVQNVNSRHSIQREPPLSD